MPPYEPVPTPPPTIGNLDANGGHLIYITGTSYLKRGLSNTVGAVTSPINAPAELTLLMMMSWRS